MKQVSEVQLSETPQEFPFRVLIDQTPTGLINHWHKEIEFIYLQDGHINMYINGRDYSLNTGDIIFFAGGDVHGAAQSNFNSRLVVQFDDSLLKTAYINENELEQIRRRIASIERYSGSWNEFTKSEIRNILLKMQNEYNIYIRERSVCRKLMIQTLIFKLINICLSGIPINPNQSEWENGMLSNGVFKEINAVLRYINEHYKENITISEAASLLNFSPNYFVRYWKKYMGIPFHSYLNKYRMNIAADMLLNQNMRISEIAENVGFKDAKTFNRAFKRHAGMSPKEYKNNNRNN